MDTPVIKHVKGTGSVYDLFWGIGWKNHVRLKLVTDRRTGKATQAIILSKTEESHDTIKQTALGVFNGNT
jgi:hypothetical protein